MKTESLGDIARYIYGLSWESWDLYFRNYVACSCDREPLRISRLRAIPYKEVQIKNNEIHLPNRGLHFSEMDKFLNENFSKPDYRDMLKATKRAMLAMLQDEKENALKDKKLRADTVEDLDQLIRLMPRLVSTMDNLALNPLIETEPRISDVINSIQNCLSETMPAFSQQDLKETINKLRSLKLSIKKDHVSKTTTSEKGVKYLHAELLRIAERNKSLPSLSKIPTRDESLNPYSDRFAKNTTRSPQLFSTVLAFQIVNLFGLMPKHSYRKIGDLVQNTSIETVDIDIIAKETINIVQQSKDYYRGKNHTLVKSIDYFALNTGTISKMKIDHPLTLKKIHQYERSLVGEQLLFTEELINKEGFEGCDRFYESLYKM